MIIRKPYAFLIKNFRKIHIVLLILSFFIIFNTFDVFSFVRDFMAVGNYDLYANPVTNHITGLLNISLLIVIVGTAALLLLLHHKKKPWKVYLIPLITYVLLFLVLSMIKSFFRTYTEVVDSADLRMSRDLLMLAMVGQLPAIGVFVMRTFGLDFKKFDFNSDLEFLDLSEEDREEIEVSLDVDYNSFKRLFRKFIRHLKYFYKEHKLISRIIIVGIVVFILSNLYTFFFVYHRTYKQGQTYKANGYSIVVEDAYFTDKDKNGKVMSKDSNFVIVRVSVTNNQAARTMNPTNFHLKAWSRDYVTTDTTYATEFSDLGKCYSNKKEIKRDEKINFIIIFKVDKKVRRGRFKLYYQEYGGIFKLRRIKVKIKDIRKIESAKKINVGEFMDVNIYGNEDSLSIDKFSYSKSIEYKTTKCTDIRCEYKTFKYDAPDGYQVLTLEFASDYYESKNIIDFLTKYGKINYKNSKGKDESLDIKIAVNKNYYGKTVYLRVPEDMEKSKDTYLDFIIRNKEYKYMLS